MPPPVRPPPVSSRDGTAMRNVPVSNVPVSAARAINANAACFFPLPFNARFGSMPDLSLDAQQSGAGHDGAAGDADAGAGAADADAEGSGGGDDSLGGEAAVPTEQSVFKQARKRHYDIRAALAEAKQMERDAGGWENLE